MFSQVIAFTNTTPIHPICLPSGSYSSTPSAFNSLVVKTKQNTIILFSLLLLYLLYYTSFKYLPRRKPASMRHQFPCQHGIHNGLSLVIPIESQQSCKDAVWQCGQIPQCTGALTRGDRVWSRLWGDSCEGIKTE